MSHISKIEIKESLEELQKIYRLSKNYRIRLKVKSLILVKENKLGKHEKIANHLSISHATLKRWLKEYNEQGLSCLLNIKRKGKPKSLIDCEIKKALKQRLNDKTKPFTGYLEVKLWLNQTYDIDVKYSTIRNYLIKNFKSKIKSTKNGRCLQLGRLE